MNPPNKYQLRTPPGDPLAVKRGYCICPGWTPTVEWDEHHEPLRMHFQLMADVRCPLHGQLPEHELPEGI